MPTMKETPDWLRATITGKSVGVDREKKVLRGYVIAQEGPFKSDGRGEFDTQALMTLVKLGNAKEGGLKSRFTHPDMSNDGLGKFLGRAKNLYMDKATDERTGKRVNAIRGDLYFDKTALETPPQGGKPLGEYVMDLAESDPDALSSSIVVQADQEFRMTKEGKYETDEEGNELPPLWRPTALHASDIVDTGDAVDGLLSIEGMPLAELWKGEKLLDSVFDGQDRGVVEARLNDYVGRYLDRKFGEQPEPTPRPIAAAKADLLAEMKRTAKMLKNG